MSLLTKAAFNFFKSAAVLTSIRALSITKQLNIKELREYKEGDKLIVEGVTLPSPRTELLLKPENISNVIPAAEGEKSLCYMCKLGLDVKHTDVLILSQFVRSDGCMLPRRITGLCRVQQKKVGKMVTMAQKAGLMINLTPSYCKKDPKKRYGHKKFNTYFDERTIFWKTISNQRDKFKR